MKSRPSVAATGCAANIGMYKPAHAVSIMALGLLSIISAPEAVAAYYSHVSSGAYIVDDTFTDLQPWAGWVENGTGPFATSPMTTSASSSNPGGTFGGVTVSSSGFVDLATGSMGGTGYLNFPLSADSNVDYAGGHSWITMADSFRAYDSSNPAAPFTWGSNSASFSFLLTGSVIANFGDTWSLQLDVAPAGSLANGWAYANNNSITGAVWFGGSSGNVRGQFVENALTTAQWSGSLSTGGISLSADFIPGGDFDWVLTLQVGGAAGAGFGNILKDVDMSHTAQVAYEGPSGSVTTSASGVFPGTSPVPLPPALWMFGSGLTALIAFTRRRTRRT